MSKLLKLNIFVLVFVWAVPQVMAWDTLKKYEDKAYKSKLEYDDEAKLVRIRYKRRGSWGRMKVAGPYSVVSPSSVDQALADSQDFMARHLFVDETIDAYLDRIHEFKFLSTKECQALHFSPFQISQDTQAISELLHQVEKIRHAQNPGSEAYRSLLVKEFTTEKDGVIQLRFVLDKEGNFLKFSFAKEEGSLVNFDWQAQKDTVVLRNPQGEVVFELNLSSFSEQGGLAVVKHPKSFGLEEEVRSYFRFTRMPNEDDSWDIYPYTTQHFKETVIREGVALTSGVASHTPIIQLNGSEIVYPRLDTLKLKSHTFLTELDEESKREVEILYNQCMGERLSFLYEEERLGLPHRGEAESEQQSICERISFLEGINILLKQDARDFKSTVESGFNPDELGLNKHVRTCLKEKGLSSEGSLFFSFDHEKVKNLDSEGFDEVFESCYREGKKNLMSEGIKYFVFHNANLSEQMPSDRSLELLWDSVGRGLREKCLDVIKTKDLEDCWKFSQVKIDENLFLAQLSKTLADKYENNPTVYGQERLRLVQGFEKCREEGKKEFEEKFSDGLENERDLLAMKQKDLLCAKEVIVQMGSVGHEEYFKNAFQRSEALSDLGLNLDKINFEESLNLFKNCLEEQVIEESSLENLISRLAYHQEVCLTPSLRPAISDLLFKEATEIFEKYDFGLNDQQKETISKRLKRLVDRELENWQQLDSLAVTRLELLPLIYSEILEEHVKGNLRSRFGPDDFGRVAEEALEKRMGELLNENSQKPLGLKTKDFFLTLKRNSEQQGVELKNFLEIAMKDTLREFHKSRGPYETVAAIGEKVLLEADREEMARRVDGEFSECLDDFSPNRTFPLERKLLECEKKRLAGIELELSKRKFERLVGQRFPLTSIQANRILSPIQYLDECFSKVDPYNSQSIESYKKLLEGCKRVAELDISYNLSNSHIEEYRPLLSQRGYHDAVTNYCYAIIFSHVSREAEKSHIPGRKGISSWRDLSTMQREQRSRTPLQGSLLRYLSGNSFQPEYDRSDKKNLMGLIETFAKNDNLTEEWWAEKLNYCEKGAEDFVMVSFREYVMESIPALNFGNSKDVNAKLMRDFLDFELVKGLMDYKKAFAERTGGLVDLGNVVPGERNISPDLGITAITNFINVLGDLLSRGFVYDEAAMRTELVVFQSELKSFLRWSTKNPDNISLREAKDFFKESKLSEHLALAVFSEKTYERFSRGIGQMKKEELEEFFKRADCLYISCLDEDERQERLKILRKYERLLKLSKEMTASYDFRRIIRPESDDGEEIINLIKDAYLQPKILGSDVSAAGERRVLRAIGAAILRDNTDGGFAERFVEEVAQYDLTKEENDRWGITKWLFFDDNDFDWEALRKTKAGQQALKYYSRFIMLPRFLGYYQTSYEKSIRMQRFRKLLDKAQSQNED